MNPKVTWFFVAALTVASVRSQTTQAVVLGRITDQASDAPLAARIICEQLDGPSRFESHTNPDGTYAFLSVPPGTYRLSVEASGSYRPAELNNLTAPVGGYLEQDFKLRLLTDLWQRGLPRTVVANDGKTVLLFYGPDVDTTRAMSLEKDRGIQGSLEPSISEVVRSPFEQLPLAGRDAYTLVALQPGVASDTSTTRGLGVAVNGQRPSASNYLLDGLEFNNYLITGPLAPIPPEAIAEYRISTNNFSAEYGRTSGFLANTVTKSGGRKWHGVGYAYLKNEALNAAETGRTSRLPAREKQQGIQAGGPLPVAGLFSSSFFQFASLRSWGDAASYQFPSRAYIAGLDTNSAASRVLNRYAPPETGESNVNLIRQPDSVSTFTALERVDYAPGSGSSRYFARLAISRQSDPYFIWSPYRDFDSRLDNNATAIAAGFVHTGKGGLTTEIRGSLGTDLLQWNNPVPAVPTLLAPEYTLPGTPAVYFFSNRGSSGELDGNLFFSAGRHVVKIGGGVLTRNLHAQLTVPQSTTTYRFQDLDAFAQDRPLAVQFETTRLSVNPAQYVEPQQDRQYRYTQFFGFAQDSFRLTSRFLIHLGVRYESFGAPTNIGANRDALLTLGPGSSFPERLSTAMLLQPPSGGERLYDADHSNVAIRAGFAWNLQQNGKTSFRGGYGIYYDRPFDNLWLNSSLNNAVMASTSLGRTVDFLQPLASILNSATVNRSPDELAITLYQPRLRTPYSQSIFASLQHSLSRNFLAETNYTGSLGRRLLTTDLVNRQYSTCLPGFALNNCRYNRAYDDEFAYEANQGFSSYHAFTASLRANSPFLYGGIHYTWSHSIDNQTEPLTALTTNLETTRLSGPVIRTRPAQFAEQFNSSGDKGNSDFDQRHTLTLYAVLPIGALKSSLRGWSLSGLAAFRSGQPFTVYSSSDSFIPGVPGIVSYNRADLTDVGSLYKNTGSLGTGVRLINPASFSNPVNALGSTSRNEFRGPGLYNIDLSLSRSFPWPWFGEGARATFRVDAYNALNHANLNNLTENSSVLTNPNFGVAEYGRQDQRSSLPSASPLNETARQLQLMLKIVF